MHRCQFETTLVFSRWTHQRCPPGHIIITQQNQDKQEGTVRQVEKAALCQREWKAEWKWEQKGVKFPSHHTQRYSSYCHWLSLPSFILVFQCCIGGSYRPAIFKTMAKRIYFSDVFWGKTSLQTLLCLMYDNTCLSSMLFCNEDSGSLFRKILNSSCLHF